MNNNNVFYQLREQDNNNILALDRVNGNFNINLKRPLILNEGDELLINKAIIDTRTLESDKIILVNDITIDFNLSYYLLNDSILSESRKFNPNGGTPWTAGDLDYELYVLGVPTGPANPTEVFIFREVRYMDPNITNIKMPPFELTYSYIDVNGILRIVNVKVSLNLQNTEGSIIWESDQLVIAISKTNQFINITDPDILYHNGISGGVVEKQLVDKDPVELNTFTPFINKIQISLQKGDYNYSDFADRINEKITFINNNDSITPDKPGGNNTLLLNTSHPIYAELFKENPIWIRSTDGAKGFVLEPTEEIPGTPERKVYFGTNQFVLLFDDITNRFFFKYLNMPIYDGDSGNQAIKFESVGPGDELKLTNKSSGVLIDSIISTDTLTGLTIDLFSDKLGFNVSSLQPNYSPVSNTTLLGTNARSFKCNLNDGLNTTGGLSSLDVILQKKAPIATPPALPEQNLYKLVPSLPTLGYILIDQQNEIYASNAVGLGSALPFGYYIIALDGLQGDYITRNDIKNNIFAIISRYYSSNNYTVGSPEDAIIYTHRGKPQILNNLNIRILNGDFRFITNLGTDNTLFLQHRKARVPLDMIQQLEEQQAEKKK